MNNLVYYTPGSFNALSHLPDVKVWLGMFRVFTDNVSFVDRTNTITPPIRTETLAHNAIPVNDGTFNLNFDECAVARAEEIYNKHLEFGVPIRVHWSGGIDSSTALMSFIELLGVSRAKQVVEVVMTSNGLIENPWVWERIVRKENFKLIHSMHFAEKWDGSEIMVNGESGDQVHGVDIYRFLRRLYGPDSLTMPWTEGLIRQHVKTRLQDFTDAEVDLFVNLLITQVRNAPIEITTLGDFWWWLNFSCKWSSVIYRLIAKSPRQVDTTFTNNYFFPFFASDKFQLWSMYKREEKHKGNWETYKWKAKEFVSRVSNCPEYQFKHRQGSLTTVLSHTTKCEGIDNNYNLYKKLNPEDWYNLQNSYKV
jgi:hypothetical protein